MRVGDEPVHLTYCTNVHPGEHWRELLPALERSLPAVKKRVSPDAPMGVGLRLSATCARELSNPGVLRELEAFLCDRDLYVFTINGFPYGTFHGATVKQGVYRPDWRTEERLTYTNQLANLLVELLDRAEGPGSISTVPVGFADDLPDADDVQLAVDNLIRHAGHLHRLFERSGRVIALALEPEPHCLLETTADAVRFFEDHLYSRRSLGRFAELAGLSRDDATSLLPRYLGVCIDTCHAAVEFEQADEVFGQLATADVGVKKMQLSAGLRLAGVDEARRDALSAFDDPVYLHQVVARRGEQLHRYLDLPDALAAWRPEDADAEWRVHFHVPIFMETLERCSNTQPFLREALAHQRQHGVTPHLEVETYTWQVLPEALRTDDLETSIARELTWVLDRL